MKSNKRNLFLIIQLVCLTMFLGCSDSDKNYKDNSERFFQLTEKEQADLAPTALFRAVYTNDQALFNDQQKTLYTDFAKKNIEGDTALAVAIKLRRDDLVQYLIQNSTLKDLTTPNQGQRSYISLLAEYDMEKAFDIFREKFVAQAGAWNSLFMSFDTYDFLDANEMFAAHYAQSATFMEKLENLWFYGALEVSHPYNSFHFQYDVHGDYYLHKAAEHNKTDVISWYVKKYCLPFGEEKGYISSATDYLLDFKYLPIRRVYINRQNNDGNTALHIAVQKGNVEAVRWLMLCAEIDPVMYNGKSQAPITLLLSTLDPDQEVLPDNYKKEVFDRLVDQADPLWPGIYPFRRIVNAQDDNGFSAIQYAARMRDRYFYNKLVKYDDSAADGSGVVPSDRYK